jgi:hypothetical protein
VSGSHRGSFKEHRFTDALSRSQAAAREEAASADGGGGSRGRGSPPPVTGRRLSRAERNAGKAGGEKLGPAAKAKKAAMAKLMAERGAAAFNKQSHAIKESSGQAGKGAGSRGKRA